MNIIDNFLDKFTMYRLVLYELIVYLVAASVLSIFKLVPFSFFSIVVSSIFLVCVSYIANKIFAKVFEVPANVESVYITALILACIISPIRSIADLSFLGWAAVWGIAGKFIFVINKKHIFNPAALAAAITAFFLNQSASWWIGNVYMMPILIVGGYFIVRKIQRERLVFSFLAATLSTIIFFTLLTGGNIISILKEALLHSPLIFFATVMLTEPLTTPPTKLLQTIYGIFVGILFSPEVHLGSFYFTPEMALLTGNIFSYIVSPKYKLLLTLTEKLQISPDTFDFIFTPLRKISYEPGQYMEWTLVHNKTDSRGNRRYFTLASSPTENTLLLGVKFYKDGSSFKTALETLTNKTPIIAANLGGDFTLPRDKSKRLVFVAGGIGITPFRSMLKYLIDKQEKRDIVVLYSNKNYKDIVYADILSEAQNLLGIKNVCTLTEGKYIPENWSGKVGRIDSKIIQEEIPDYKDRIFYLSGPLGLVEGFENTLKDMGVSNNQIKKDFFPGY